MSDNKDFKQALMLIGMLLGMSLYSVAKFVFLFMGWIH